MSANLKTHIRLKPVSADAQVYQSAKCTAHYCRALKQKHLRPALQLLVEFKPLVILNICSTFYVKICDDVSGMEKYHVSQH